MKDCSARGLTLESLLYSSAMLYGWRWAAKLDGDPPPLFSVCVSVSLSLSVSVSLSLSLSLSVSVSLSLSVSGSGSVSHCPRYHSVSPSVGLSVCLCLCLSLFLIIHVVQLRHAIWLAVAATADGKCVLTSMEGILILVNKPF